MFEDGEFQWDIEKADKNFRKHGVRFEKARKSFDDIYSITIPDKRKNYEEDRFNLIGIAGNGEEDPILVVTHTYSEDKTRIISAREAEPNEKSKYLNSRGGDSSWEDLLDSVHRIKRKRRGRSF